MPRTNTIAVKKDERLYIRATKVQKAALTRAARARHLHTTESVLQVSLQVTEEVIAQEDKILLSERDFDRFVALIENPPPPTDKPAAADGRLRGAKTGSAQSQPVIPSFVVGPLAAHHDRSGFDCGKPVLNEFLQRQARQNADRNAGMTHVDVSATGQGKILAYYTLLTRDVDKVAA